MLRLAMHDARKFWVIARALIYAFITLMGVEAFGCRGEGKGALPIEKKYIVYTSGRPWSPGLPGWRNKSSPIAIQKPAQSQPKLVQLSPR